MASSPRLRLLRVIHKMESVAIQLRAIGIVDRTPVEQWALEEIEASIAETEAIMGLVE